MYLFKVLLKQVLLCSVSLIECGPVNTDFYMNLKRTELSDDQLEIDAFTRSLYKEYLKHCQSVFQNAAQDTDDIIQVHYKLTLALDLHDLLAETEGD